MGFVIFDLFPADLLQTRHAVGRSPPVQLFQARQLIVIKRHDDLAAQLVRQTALFTKIDHRVHTFDRHLGLETAWLVIDARVDHTAVVAGLMKSNLTLFV